MYVYVCIKIATRDVLGIRMRKGIALVFSLMRSLKLHRRCERRKSLSCRQRTLLASLSCCLKCSLRSSVSLSLCLWTLSFIDLACPVTSFYPSSYLWSLEDVPRDSPRRPDAVVDYVRERTVSWCGLRITPYTIQIGIDNCIPDALQSYVYIYTHTARIGMGARFNCLALRQ